MNKKKLEKLSIYLSYILRHKPEDIDMKLDNEGYLDIVIMMNNINLHSKHHIDSDILLDIVRTDKKGRYQISEDGKKIRALQGHSIGLSVLIQKPYKPQTSVYHGTSVETLNEIIKSGEIKPINRDIHMTHYMDMAFASGKRKGSPVAIEIDVQTAVRDGLQFYISDNNVVLSKTPIPIKYIKCIHVEREF